MTDRAGQAMSQPPQTAVSETWLVNEINPITEDDLAQIEQKTPTILADTGRRPEVARLAVRLRKVVCRDVQRWFGLSAEIRLDALVVHGAGHNDPASFYMPGTFRFADMHDRQPFPIDADNGQLIFNGAPLHFIDIFVVASRNRKDSDDLAKLLGKRLAEKETKAAIAGLLALTAVTVPTAAAVAGAVAAAATLGDLAYQVIKAASPKTIGMYRGSFLQFRDGFGVGRHPQHGLFKHNDLEFWFDVVLDEPRS